LILKIHKEKIKDLIFLKDSPYDLIVTVLPMFVNVNYVKGDLIFCLGEFVEEMFLVVKGCLSIHLGYEYHNIEVAQIKVNHHFGDILMYSNEQSLIECKIKSRLSELLILKKLDHSKLKMKFPELITKSLKKSLENYKFIMDRRVLFIKTITNTHSNDLEVIMKEIKKVRYKSTDKELVNLQSYIEEQKEGLGTVNSNLKEKGRRNGLINEKMLRRSVNQVISQIKNNITSQGGNTILENNTKDEINKFAKEIDNDIHFYSELKNSNYKINQNKTFVDLNSPSSPSRNREFKRKKTKKMIKKKKKRTSEFLSSNNKENYSDRGKDKDKDKDKEKRDNPNININYFHIENNVDKFIYVDNNDMDINFPFNQPSFIIRDNDFKRSNKVKTTIFKSEKSGFIPFKSDVSFSDKKPTEEEEIYSQDLKLDKLINKMNIILIQDSDNSSKSKEDKKDNELSEEIEKTEN